MFICCSVKLFGSLNLCKLEKVIIHMEDLNEKVVEELTRDLQLNEVPAKADPDGNPPPDPDEDDGSHDYFDATSSIHESSASESEEEEPEGECDLTEEQLEVVPY